MASDHLPSPTLTNPDMILPFDSDISDTTSSSPPRKFQRPPSPLTYPPPDGQAPMRKAVLNLFGNGHRSRDKHSDMTTLRGGATNPEVEGERSRQSQRTSMSSALASSPTLHDEYDLTSTSDVVSDGANEETWEGFDSPANGEIMNQYQYLEATGFMADRDKIGKSNRATRTGLNDDMNDSYPSAAMSIRAEQILANAKKRLTNMEGNLNRARSGLNSRPSSSMSSFPDRNTHAVSLYRLPGSSNGGFTPQTFGQSNSMPSSGNSKGHLRVSSETSIPSASLHARAEELQREGVRASSAMGSNGMRSDSNGISEEQDPLASRNWFWAGLTRNGSYAGHYNNSLEPLHEDEPAPASSELPVSREITPPSDEKSDNTSNSQKPLDAATFDTENPPANGLTRARSTNQMRDLRDQMQDLKGKISSLKQRARQDSMRRRSLQSLRTPSPFTAAEQWYAGSLGYRDVQTTRGSSVPPPARSPQTHGDTLRPGSQEHQMVQSAEHSQEPTIIEESSEDGSLLHPRQHEADVDQLSQEHVKPAVDPRAEEEVELREADPESLDDRYRAKGTNEEQDSLYGDQDYHESFPTPMGERHEDRPDAFDYEHFFLHSGIGTVSRGDLSRSSSNSSMYSVETTKPANVTVEKPEEVVEDSANGTPKAGQGVPPHSENGHYRKDSAGSISTVATFATATEGRASEADEDEWILQRPRAGVFEPDFSIQYQLATSPLDTPPAEIPRRIRSMRGATVRRFPVNASSTSSSTIPGRSNSLSEPAKTVGSAKRPFPSADLFAVLAAASPLNEGEQLQLNNSDKELVERLVTSLSNVCSYLHSVGIDGSKYEGRAWRRRLDAARRVLDGEINGEAF